MTFQAGNTIFRVSFLHAEIPSQLISKKLGPDRWIPMQMTLWSIVAMSQVALTGKATFYATRSILGVLEVSTRPKHGIDPINHPIFREALFPI